MGLMGFLTSCHSGNDHIVPEPETNWEVPISFSGHEDEAQDVTRAGSPLNESGANEFKVWGFKSMSFDDKGDADPSNDEYGTDWQTVFPGYIVKWQSNSASTTVTNTNNWEYILLDHANQYVKYWDWSAKAYRFFAVTNWEGEPPLTYEDYKAYGTNGAYETYEVSMLADASDATEMEKTPFFSRLWFSTGDPVTYADKQFGRPVQLEFLKPYARVRFIFNYVFPREGIILEDVSFKPSDGSEIVRKGKVTVTYPLSGTGIQESYAMTANDDADPDVRKALTEFTEDFDPENTSKEYPITGDGWYDVLPNLTQGTYTLSVKINKGAEPKTAVVPATYMRWLPGYSYTYVFRILDEGGVEIGWVESAVTPWTDINAHHTVYNW